MTRRKKPERVENDKRMKAAIESVLNGEYPSAHAAAGAYGVPRATLYHRINGRPSRQAGQESLQLLSHAKEKELRDWITRLTITGYAPRHSTVREMAHELRLRHRPQIDEITNLPIYYPPIGQQWVQRFLGRHSELKSTIGTMIDAARVTDSTHEMLSEWFDTLRQVIQDYNITSENMYNMDESGFAIGTIEATQVIINTNIRQQFQAHPGRQEWVTCVECICANGTAIPSLVIFRGENLVNQWIPASVSSTWMFSCNSKGWTSNKHGLEWLERVFEPSTRAKAGGQYRLLICDGHDSHITGAFVAHCMDYDIVLLILPPHSSHLTQLLDVSIFRPLKKTMATEIALLIHTGVSRIQKVEWAYSVYQSTRKSFFSTEY